MVEHKEVFEVYILVKSHNVDDIPLLCCFYLLQEFSSFQLLFYFFVDGGQSREDLRLICHHYVHNLPSNIVDVAEYQTFCLNARETNGEPVLRLAETGLAVEKVIEQEDILVFSFNPFLFAHTNNPIHAQQDRYLQSIFLVLLYVQYAMQLISGGVGERHHRQSRHKNR